jgi:hypothetical protein
VFLLVAGLMRSGSDQLLLLMESEARKYINTPKLQALLRWVDDETAGSTGDIKPVGKRALAIANAYANANATAYVKVIAYAYANAYVKVNAYAYANANANADADANAFGRFIEYAHDLENLKIFKNINLTGLIAQMEALKAQIPSKGQPGSVRKSFSNHLSNHLIETWLHAFNLTAEMLDLSEEEIEALENYLYANHLIIKCKDAAVQVTPSTWEAIEERMLRID